MRPTHMDTIPIARLQDPAFAGIPLSVVAEYARSRDPEALPEALPGTSPVIFHVRRLSRSVVLDFVENQSNDQKRFVSAFMAGVVRVTGGRFGDQGWEPETIHARDHVAMTEAELDACDFSISCMVEIGSVIYMKSIAPKDCSPRYPVRPSSLHVWEGLDHPSAERNRADAARTNDAPEAD